MIQIINLGKQHTKYMFIKRSFESKPQIEILSRRTDQNGRTLYEIKWMTIDSKNVINNCKITWERINDLTQYAQLIQQFERKQEESANWNIRRECANCSSIIGIGRVGMGVACVGNSSSCFQCSAINNNKRRTNEMRSNLNENGGHISANSNNLRFQQYMKNKNIGNYNKNQHINIDRTNKSTQSKSTPIYNISSTKLGSRNNQKQTIMKKNQENKTGIAHGKPTFLKQKNKTASPKINRQHIDLIDDQVKQCKIDKIQLQIENESQNKNQKQVSSNSQNKNQILQAYQIKSNFRDQKPRQQRVQCKFENQQVIKPQANIADCQNVQQIEKNIPPKQAGCKNTFCQKYQDLQVSSQSQSESELMYIDRPGLNQKMPIISYKNQHIQLSVGINENLLDISVQQRSQRKKQQMTQNNQNIAQTNIKIARLLKNPRVDLINPNPKIIPLGRRSSRWQAIKQDKIVEISRLYQTKGIWHASVMVQEGTQKVILRDTLRLLVDPEKLVKFYEDMLEEKIKKGKEQTAVNELE